MPSAIDGRVRLAPEEQALIELLTGESINPKTVDDLNAWIDAAAKVQPGDDAETKLLKAICGQMRLVGLGMAPGSFRSERPEPAKVIPFRKN